MRSFSTIALFPRIPRTGIAVLGAALAFSMATPSHAAAKKKDTAAKVAKKGKKGSGDKKAEAHDAFAAAEEAYKNGDYKTAYDNFRKANDLIPSVVADYWMAMSMSYGDDVPSAIANLEQLLLSPDAEKLGEEKLNTADARLKELKNTPASVNVTSDPAGAEVALDDKAQPGITPLTLTVPPGTHKLTVALKGYEPYSADLTVKPAQKLDQSATLEKSKEPPPKPVAATPPPAPAPAPAAPPAAAEKDNLPAYIALGAAVVGAGVGTFFGIKALSAKSDFDSHPTNDNADRTERNALISDMSFGIALALGITGGVLLFTNSADSSEVSGRAAPHPQRARLDIAPILTQHTQGAAARVTF